MSMRAALPVAAVLFLLAGCDSARSTEPLARPAPTARADASSPTYTFFVPLQFSRWVPCANGGAGETVDLSGSLQQVFTLTTSSDGIVHLLYHHNLVDVSGVGETTGEIYRYNGVANDAIELAIGGAVNVGETWTVTDNFQMVGQGSGTVFTLSVLWHVTVNPDGTLTSYIYSASIGC